jgi:NAD(P)-dependent dehydrogenase (short-subunit alcohol dehydrogenase family)
VGLLEGRRAIVTGGASGIGRATCERFQREGARVAVVDIVEDAEFPCDVRDADRVREVFAAAADAMGGLDILVNNAGAGSLSPLHRYSDAEWDRVLAVNLTGVFNGLRAAIPLMRDTGDGGGAVVNVASVAGSRPTPGEAPYGAAKAAVIQLTRTAALENAPRIRVNSVSPGMIDTPLTSMLMNDERATAMIAAATPMGRAGTADEVAGVIAFLCSELASYVTGIDVAVDGGAQLPIPQIDAYLAGFVRALDRS